MGLEAAIKERVRNIPDYPKKGIIFRDITPLLKDKRMFAACIDELAARTAGFKPDYIVGIEARGFIVGSALAYKMGTGFIPIRKKGKLPYDKVSRSYSLEYGQETIEMHSDAIERSSKVLIVDDLLATGGTTLAAMDLVRQMGGDIVGLAYMIELADLNARSRLGADNVVSLVKY